LEFVLVFPLLIGILVVGWYVASGGMTRARVATEARTAAWAQRESAGVGVPFDLRHAPTVGMVDADTTRVIPKTSPLSGKQDTAETHANALFETWDAKTFPLPKLPPRTIITHKKEILHFGRFIPILLRLQHSLNQTPQADPWTHPKAASWAQESARLYANMLQKLPDIATGVPSLIAASIELKQRAAQVAYYAPPLAAWYLFESFVIDSGVVRVPQLFEKIGR
jgi:hypothetical protein